MKKLVHILSLLAFLAVLAAIALFVEGYQYDPAARDLVKKGVVYFQKLGIQKNDEENVQVLVDGQVTPFKFPGDIRVVPGVHELEIRRDGYFPWKKTVQVNDEEIVKFPEIRLLSRSAAQPWPLKKNEDSVEAFDIQSFSDEGIFLTSSKLHVAKFFDVNRPDNFWITDLPLRTSFQKLVPWSRNAFLGIAKDGRLFTYQPKQLVFLPQIKPVNIISVDETLYVLDKKGALWKMDDAESEPTLFLNFLRAVKTVRGQRQKDGRLLWLGDGVLLLTDREGRIEFQETGIATAFYEDENLYFLKGKKWIWYDIAQKEFVTQSEIAQNIRWFSRVKDTFQAVYVTEKGTLFYGDTDFQNGHQLETLSPQFFAVSKDHEQFWMVQDDVLTRFDFGMGSGLSKLIQDFVSGIFSPA